MRDIVINTSFIGYYNSMFKKDPTNYLTFLEMILHSSNKNIRIKSESSIKKFIFKYDNFNIELRLSSDGDKLTSEKGDLPSDSILITNNLSLGSDCNKALLSIVPQEEAIYTYGMFDDILYFKLEDILNQPVLLALEIYNAILHILGDYDEKSKTLILESVSVLLSKVLGYKSSVVNNAIAKANANKVVSGLFIKAIMDEVSHKNREETAVETPASEDKYHSIEYWGKKSLRWKAIKQPLIDNFKSSNNPIPVILKIYNDEGGRYYPNTNGKPDEELIRYVKMTTFFAERNVTLYLTNKENIGFRYKDFEEEFLLKKHLFNRKHLRLLLKDPNASYENCYLISAEVSTKGITCIIGRYV